METPTVNPKEKNENEIKAFVKLLLIIFNIYILKKLVIKNSYVNI